MGGLECFLGHDLLVTAWAVALGKKGPRSRVWGLGFRVQGLGYDFGSAMLPCCQYPVPARAGIIQNSEGTYLVSIVKGL